MPELNYALDDDYCAACGVTLTKRTKEMHHFPTPDRLGGLVTIPLCSPCHDMVDRKNLIDWPLDWFFNSWLQLPREARLLLLKCLSRMTSEAEKPLLHKLEIEVRERGMP